MNVGIKGGLIGVLATEEVVTKGSKGLPQGLTGLVSLKFCVQYSSSSIQSVEYDSNLTTNILLVIDFLQCSTKTTV